MDLLALIDEIARHRPFRPETVGELTGHTLTPGRANPYYTMHRSTEAGIPFASVEVRSPTAQNPADGFVCLEVLGSRLTLADLGERWGKGQWTGPPPPDAPADRPSYHEFPQPWGVLRLGFSVATGRLVTVVLDATR
jgi:hypothetical protein